VSSVNERIEYNQERRQWIADTSKTDGGLDGDEVDGWRKVEGGRAFVAGKGANGESVVRSVSLAG
jgi:hypothetical protein